MKAIHIINPGPNSRLQVGEAPTPVPKDDELLVRVRATALNRADLLQRSGKYPPPPGASEILGLEMSGEVAGFGKDCQGWEEGQRVFGLLPGGGYAEYVTIPAALAIRMPASLTFEAAAAIPEVFLTAFQALYWLGELKGGERVLIHAGASGVGTAAIQMAIHSGASVFVTASTGKHAACLELGAQHAIDYKTEDFEAVIREKTDGEGVDLIVDFIGAPYFEQNINSLRLDGRLVLLAMMGGSRLAEVNLAKLFRKRIHFKPSTLRSRSVDYKIALTQEFQRLMLPLFEGQLLRPVIDSIFNWEEAEQAHNKMAANENTGKLVLKIG